MLKWLLEPLESPFGTASLLNWAVDDADGVGANCEVDPMPDLDDAEDQLGSVLWNSNSAVLTYLHDEVFPSGGVKGLNIIELGAGVGALGIPLAMAGARTAVTDIKELVPLMRRNIDINLWGEKKAACVACAWRWGESMPRELRDHFPRGFDCLLMCDALYGNPKDWSALIATLNDVAKISKKKSFQVINFCEQRVENVEDAFIRLLETDPCWRTETRDLASVSQLGMKVRVTFMKRNDEAEEQQNSTSTKRNKKTSRVEAVEGQSTTSDENMKKPTKSRRLETGNSP